MANKNQGRAASATPANPTAQLPSAEVQPSDNSRPPAADQLPGQGGSPELPQSNQEVGPQANPPPEGANSEPPNDPEVVLATVRHKTQYPLYHRAGLVLSKQPKEYRVTRDQLDILSNDLWVEVLEV